MGEVIEMVSLDVIKDMIAELDDATIKKAITAWDAVGVMLAEERERRGLPISKALKAVKVSALFGAKL